MVKNNKYGFSLVELLVVIAILAILSLAAVNLINPVDKTNRAFDAGLENDAAEALGALERYSIAKISFPWMDVDNRATVTSMNEAWFGRSDEIGFGLCFLAGLLPPNSRCTDYQANPGLLINLNELKPSFLGKGYTSIKASDPNYNANGMNYLWVDKKWVASAQMDAIYVCYIPKAVSDRTVAANLKRPVLDASGSQVIGLTATVATDFSGNNPAAAWDFKTPVTSLFKCVP